MAVSGTQAQPRAASSAVGVLPAQTGVPTQKIVTYLWFDHQAEEAVDYYASIFPDSRVLEILRVGDQVMSVTFQLAGQRFMAINGGPHHSFNDAISLLINCDGQDEVDRLWATFVGDGGQEGPCGWLKDKYDLSWQIVPTALLEMFADPDRGAAGRAMQAMQRMRKIDVAGLRRAFDAR